MIKISPRLGLSVLVAIAILIPSFATNLQAHDPDEDKIVARSIMKASTKDGKQHARAKLVVDDGVFGEVVLNCKTWSKCNLVRRISAGIVLHEVDPSIDIGTPSADTCNGKGVCTAKYKFDLADTDPFSITFNVADATGLKAGEAVLSLDPGADNVHIEGGAANADLSGAAASALGEAGASNKSMSEVRSDSVVREDGLGAVTQTSGIASNRSTVNAKSNAHARHAGAVASASDDVTADNKAKVTHKIGAVSHGDGVVTNCSATGDSSGRSHANLIARVKDGKHTKHVLDIDEKGKEPGASVETSLDCGDMTL